MLITFIENPIYSLLKINDFKSVQFIHCLSVRIITQQHKKCKY